MSNRAGANRLATYSDLLKLPDNVIGEIIDGELVVSPRPASPHARAGFVLSSDLSPFDKLHGKGGPGGWWILYEPELHMGPDVIVPDLAGWRRERMPQIPKVAAFDLAPDWVCEIISPSSTRHDRIKKPRIYGKAGVEWLWIVDPEQKTLEVMQHQTNGWLTVSSHSESEIVRAQPFEAIEIELEAWWL